MNRRDHVNLMLTVEVAAQRLPFLSKHISPANVSNNLTFQLEKMVIWMRYKSAWKRYMCSMLLNMKARCISCYAITVSAFWQVKCNRWIYAQSGGRRAWVHEMSVESDGRMKALLESDGWVKALHSWTVMTEYTVSMNVNSSPIVSWLSSAVSFAAVCDS